MSTARLLRSAPYFPVTDVGATSVYYSRVFGFRTEYTTGTPPMFAICSRDEMAVMLRKVEKPDHICPNEKQGGTWDAFFWVDDAKALHAEMFGKGAVVIYGPLVQEAYSMLEFAVRDPDGHVLGFGQSLPDNAKGSA